jgi:glyceraldehyde 3-phosphate dehydrogenase
VTGVLPDLAGRLSIAAVRVPCLSVSAIDAVIQTRAPLPEPACDWLRAALVEAPMIGLTEDPCVSTDFRGCSESLVLALPEIQKTGSGQLRLLGWYDNEWGFSARMIEMTRRMAARAEA